MAKAGDVGGSVERHNWFRLCFMSWKARIWLVVWRSNQARQIFECEEEEGKGQRPIQRSYLLMDDSVQRLVDGLLSANDFSLPSGSAGSSRTSSQSGCPLHEAPPYDATATRKGEVPCEGKVGQSWFPTDSVFSKKNKNKSYSVSRHLGLLTASGWGCSSTVTSSPLVHTHTHTHPHALIQHTPTCPSGFSRSWLRPCCEFSDAATTRWVREWVSDESLLYDSSVFVWLHHPLLSVAASLLPLQRLFSFTFGKSLRSHCATGKQNFDRDNGYCLCVCVSVYVCVSCGRCPGIVGGLSRHKKCEIWSYTVQNWMPFSGLVLI